jgi:hypothetical protein
VPTLSSDDFGPWLRWETLPSIAGMIDEFDGLGASIGPVGSGARLSRLEEDARWSAEYHRVSLGGRLIGVIPVFTCRARSWPNPLYVPVRPHIAPAHCVLVGGRDGMASSLHLTPKARSEDMFPLIIGRLADIYRRRSQLLAFPFCPIEELEAVKRSDLSLDVRMEGRDARLDALFGDWPHTLRSKARSTLRHDAVEASQLGVTTRIGAWAEVADWAAPLIADHNRLKGFADHPRLVDHRVRQWERCEGMETLAFTAATAETAAVLVAVVWREWMDLQEIGLPPGSGLVRRCLYAQLIAHLPLAAGSERGVRWLRAGAEATMAKAARGATFQHIGSGLAR